VSFHCHANYCARRILGEHEICENRYNAVEKFGLTANEADSQTVVCIFPFPSENKAELYVSNHYDTSGKRIGAKKCFCRESYMA
jgi:hypothetical protein